MIPAEAVSLFVIFFAFALGWTLLLNCVGPAIKRLSYKYA